MTTPADGATPRLRVKRNARARRLSIRVTADEGVVVVAPVRMRAAAIASVLERQRPWIERTMEEVRHHLQEEPLPQELRVLDDLLRVRPSPDGGSGDGGPVVREQEGSLLVCAANTAEGLHALRQWCRGRAREVLPALTHDLARAGGFTVRRVTVRDQRTRWGSCSRRGIVSLNWRLILMPGDVMRYLIIHELAHTRAMNHGPQFWRVVAASCPGYAAAERWLRRHGKGLPL